MSREAGALDAIDREQLWRAIVDALFADVDTWDPGKPEPEDEWRDERLLAPILEKEIPSFPGALGRPARVCLAAPTRDALATQLVGRRSGADRLLRELDRAGFQIVRAR